MKRSIFFSVLVSFLPLSAFASQPIPNQNKHNQLCLVNYSLNGQEVLSSSCGQIKKILLGMPATDSLKLFQICFKDRTNQFKRCSLADRTVYLKDAIERIEDAQKVSSED